MLGVFLWRALFDLGVAPGDHLVSVHLTSADSDRRSAGPVRRPRLRHVFGVDCRAQPDAILRMLHAVRATVIMGFPGVLARVAGKVSDEDRRTLPLRLVSPFGGVLTPLTRSRLAEGFGAPVRLEPSGKLRPSRSLVASEYDGIEWESSSSASS